jgi:hypothetical protein
MSNFPYYHFQMKQSITVEFIGKVNLQSWFNCL